MRTLSKGAAAKSAVESLYPSLCKTVIEVWQLDMLSSASVQSFAQRASTELERLDIVVLNAGVYETKYMEFKGNEATIYVNVISTSLLGMLLFLKLRASAEAFDARPLICIVGSELHHIAPFPEKNAPRIFDALNDRQKRDSWGSMPCFTRDVDNVSV